MKTHLGESGLKISEIQKQTIPDKNDEGEILNSDIWPAFRITTG